MDATTLLRIATLPSEERLAAIDDLVEVLTSGEFTEADVDELERQVRQVNATLANWRRPH